MDEDRFYDLFKYYLRRTEFSVYRAEECKSCGGSGQHDYDDGERVGVNKCGECNGSGSVEVELDNVTVDARLR